MTETKKTNRDIITFNLNNRSDKLKPFKILNDIDNNFFITGNLEWGNETNQITAINITDCNLKKEFIKAQYCYEFNQIRIHFRKDVTETSFGDKKNFKLAKCFLENGQKIFLELLEYEIDETIIENCVELPIPKPDVKQGNVILGDDGP